MKKKVWLLLAVIPVLLGAYALKRTLSPASVTGGEAPVNQGARPDDSPRPSRERSATTASGSLSQESAVAQPLPRNLDPFAVLDQQYETARMAETKRFDEAEARIRASVQPALDASVAEHKRDRENLDRTNLNPDQKMQWNKQFAVKYEKARLDIKRTLQPDLDELAAQRSEALKKLESDRAKKRSRLQEIQVMADKGQIDSVTAKRTQFEVLGVTLPPSAFASADVRPAPTGTETAPPEKRPPTVQVIVATADNRFCALIEDTLVSEGDTVQGYRVRKIGTDCVEFEKDGQTWVQKAN